MIDTIKLGIPIGYKSYQKLVSHVHDSDYWQWVLHNPVSGVVRFTRKRGLIHQDSNSFHRDIHWDLPDEYKPLETYLALELSLPKFWYGHNIRLLYDWMLPLRELKRELEKHLPCRFPDPLKWEVFRVDACYAWSLGSESNAKITLESVKHLHFPRKKIAIYKDSISFPGRTYSVKLYRKHPEFLANDRPKLKQSGADQQWVDRWESISRPVLRYEGTFRRQYLKLAGVRVVADLLKLHESKVLQGQWMEDSDLQNMLLQLIIQRAALSQGFPPNLQGILDFAASLQSGAKLSEPKGLWFVGGWVDDENLVLHTCRVDESAIVDFNLEPDLAAGEGIPCWKPPPGYPQGRVFLLDGSRSLVIIKRSFPEIHLEKLLEKLFGKHRGMQDKHQVQSLLFEKYKPNKAANLLAAWLFIREYGTAKAKELLGDRTFYRRRAELKEAGVGLVEPLKIVKGSDTEVLKDFEFRVPSLYVVNRYDDQRKQESPLNLTAERIQRSLSAM